MNKVKIVYILSRTVKPPTRLNLLSTKQELLQENSDTPEVGYDSGTVAIFATTINQLNKRFSKNGKCFGQQLMLPKALKTFGEKGREAGTKAVKQLHNGKCFIPIKVSKLNKQDRKRAVEALMILTEKKDGIIKGHVVYNGNTREWLSKEDVSSPTATLESIMITSVVDAHKGRYVMTADVPNAFVQTELLRTKINEDRIVMKITGALVNMLCSLDHSYEHYVPYDKGKRVLYTRAINGMLRSALLWYKKFR